MIDSINSKTGSCLERQAKVMSRNLTPILGSHEYSASSLTRLITPEAFVRHCVLVLKPVTINGSGDVLWRCRRLAVRPPKKIRSVANRQSFGRLNPFWFRLGRVRRKSNEYQETYVVLRPVDSDDRLADPKCLHLNTSRTTSADIFRNRQFSGAGDGRRIQGQDCHRHRTI